MEYKQMMNKNIMIGTAILSTFADKKNRDSIDLILPFVKYTLHEEFRIGDVVSAVKIRDYIQTNFAFKDLPIAIIEKAINRLSKNGGCLSLSDKDYHFVRDVADEHSRLKTKREHAFLLVQRIIDNLLSFLNNKSQFKKYSNEETKRVLFSFLDKYGLTTIENKLRNQNIAKNDIVYRLIGEFILQEKDKNSEVFKDLIELIKGLFLSKAVYMQTTNESSFESRMKETVIVLDAPLLLRILGLKTQGENLIAKEFLQAIPPQVKLRYFPENFQELKKIIDNYKYQVINKEHRALTLEFFDEKNFSINEIDAYAIQLEKKLRSLDIIEYTDPITYDEKYSIDKLGLTTLLRDRIPSYNNKDLALETDILTLSNIKQIRRGIQSLTIENSKAIFVTSNKSLAKVANNFLDDPNEIGCVISEMDFTILMWLKNSTKADSVPKDILVANAMAATEEVPEVFMEAALIKIKHYEEAGLFDEESAGLILENIYFRRELVELCNGDPNELTIGKFLIAKRNYEDSLIEKAGIDNKSLKRELEQEKMARKKAEEENDYLLKKLFAKAEDDSRRISKWFKTAMLALIGIVIIILVVIGTISCINEARAGKTSISGIIMLVISTLGFIDFLLSKCRLLLKLVKHLEQKVYYCVLEKKEKILLNQ